MSSTVAPANPADANPRQSPSFWCHECVNTVTPFPSSRLCPDCRGTFLEEIHPQTQSLLLISSDSDSDSDSESVSAPRSSIDSLPTVQISDPSLLCAVCKDDFGSGSESDNAKGLPCGHVYHSQCIVPWLLRRNSCPLCRSPLPSAAGRRRRAPPGAHGDADMVMSATSMAVMLRNHARERVRAYLRLSAAAGGSVGPTADGGTS